MPHPKRREAICAVGRQGMKHYSFQDSNPKIWKILLAPSHLSWREAARHVWIQIFIHPSGFSDSQSCSIDDTHLSLQDKSTGSACWARSPLPVFWCHAQVSLAGEGSQSHSVRGHMPPLPVPRASPGTVGRVPSPCPETDAGFPLCCTGSMRLMEGKQGVFDPR